MIQSIFSATTEELDNLACKIADEISDLEIYFRDHNGCWYSAKDRRKHSRLTKKLAEIDKELSVRVPDGQ